jgi:predicted phage replisome organizer
MAKKYYWLKLQKDFFKRHDIRIIEAMPNGKDYILFYLKLLVESVSHEGYLRFSETIPYNADMLSTITNTNIDIVKSAIKIFSELSLMELMDDHTIYLNEVTKLIGEETEFAKKQRTYRERKKIQNPDIEQLEEKKVDNVSTMSDTKNTLSDKSYNKSKNLDKELDNREREEKEFPLEINLALESKLMEFRLYRKIIKKPLKTNNSINAMINGIGTEFVNEEHLIQCIDYTMAKEYQGVKGEYVKYESKKPKLCKPTKTEAYNYRKEAEQNPEEYKPIGSIMAEISKKVKNQG